MDILKAVIKTIKELDIEKFDKDYNNYVIKKMWDCLHGDCPDQSEAVKAEYENFLTENYLNVSMIPALWIYDHSDAYHLVDTLADDRHFLRYEDYYDYMFRKTIKKYIKKPIVSGGLYKIAVYDKPKNCWYKFDIPKWVGGDSIPAELEVYKQAKKARLNDILLPYELVYTYKQYQIYQQPNAKVFDHRFTVFEVLDHYDDTLYDIDDFSTRVTKDYGVDYFVNLINADSFIINDLWGPNLGVYNGKIKVIDYACC